MQKNIIIVFIVLIFLLAIPASASTVIPSTDYPGVFFADNVTGVTVSAWHDNSGEANGYLFQGTGSHPSQINVTVNVVALSARANSKRVFNNIETGWYQDAQGTITPITISVGKTAVYSF